MSAEANPPVEQEPIVVNQPPNGQKPTSHSGGAALEMRSQSFSGPLPPPELLGRYKSMCPGSADRIITLAEREAEHRRSIEHAVVAAEVQQGQRDSREAQRGQYCALAITLSAIAAGAYTALSGHEIAGSIIGVGGIGSIVTTFLIGRGAKEPVPPPPSPPTQPKNNRRKK